MPVSALSGPEFHQKVSAGAAHIIYRSKKMPFNPDSNFFKPFKCRQDDPITVAPYSKKQELRRRGVRAVAWPALAADAGVSKAPRRRPGLIVEFEGGEEWEPAAPKGKTPVERSSQALRGDT
jgi:hypothetical protein